MRKDAIMGKFMREQQLKPYNYYTNSSGLTLTVRRQHEKSSLPY